MKNEKWKMVDGKSTAVPFMIESLSGCGANFVDQHAKL
jgi:hypothetical protein